MSVAISFHQQLQFNFMANSKVVIERPEAVAKSNLKSHLYFLLFLNLEIPYIPPFCFSVSVPGLKARLELKLPKVNL